MMNGKLELFTNECIVWDGYQIGIITGKTIEMCVTTEDFENGELPLSVQKDVLANLSKIKEELTSIGYNIAT